MTSNEMSSGSTPTSNYAQQLALWADILRNCATSGLYFASNIYERERYEKIMGVAQEMLAMAVDRPQAEIEALHTTLFTRASPIVTGDAAIIEDHKILLIRRSDTGLWAMPGGGIEVGETPAEGVIREALEETGIACEPLAFIGINDSRLCGTVFPFHLYQVLFLCRPLPDRERIDPPPHAHEILEMDWFPEDALPELHPGHASRIPEAFRVWRGDQRAYFDH